MKHSPKVIEKFDCLTQLLQEIPDISIAAASQALSGQISVQHHSPLLSTQYFFRCCNRFWSKNYDLLYRCKLPSVSLLSAEIVLDKNNQFSSAQHEIFPLLQLLNTNLLLTDILKAVDLRQLNIKISPEEITLELSPMVGSIVQLLLPPLTYFIKPAQQELVAIFQILQLVLATLRQAGFVA